MSEMLDAFEILNIAQSIEKNGADFYREAARTFGQTRDVTFLEKLAVMEDSHCNTFAEMQQKLTPKTNGDEDVLSSIESYLKALSDSTNLEGSVFASYLLTGDEDLADIVLIGIDLEKETILYYLGLKDILSEQADKNVLDEIIREEKRHVVTLVEEYRKLRA